MQIWAHRGASGCVPENTIEAFKKAIDLQADGIELDVQLSLDGKVVVVHDESLSRVSDGEGYVKDHTLAQLKTLNFSKVMPEYQRTEIPTLREVLQLLKNTDLQLNIELKTGRFFYPGIEEKTLELVKHYEMQDKVWYSSFNHYTIKKIKELCPKAKCGVLYSDGIYEPAEYAKVLGVEALHPYVINMQYPKFMEKCKANQLKVHAWTANSYSDIVQCIQSGVDAMITNYPDRARMLALGRPGGHAIFDNPFEAQADKEYYLFGAGYLGQHFLKKYSGRKAPVCILDNGEAKWGTCVNGIRVAAPECLTSSDRVVIASIYYPEIIAQLEKLGISDYYVYDVSCDWK